MQYFDSHFWKMVIGFLLILAVALGILYFLGGLPDDQVTVEENLAGEAEGI